MDWDTHAQDYWKDKPSAQAKKHPSKERKIMIAIGAVIAVLILFGASYLVRRGSTSEQEKAEKEVTKLAPIKLNSIKAAHTESCLLQAGGKNNRWANFECRERCHGYRDMLPRPTMWRSCLSGCEKGANAALEFGCSTITTAAHCEHEVKKRCNARAGDSNSDAPCSALVGEEPSPALFEMCSTNCRGELLRACDRAISTLGDIRNNEL